MAYTFEKKSIEIIRKGITYANRVPAGTTVVALEVKVFLLSAGGETDKTSDILVPASDAFTDDTAQALFQAGVKGSRYRIEFRATMSGGALYVDEYIMTIV